MDTDIQDYISKCHKCQVGRKRSEPPQLLSPLPQCTEPQQRVHADLFGPLKTTIGDKKYILSMTDAFTKYAELVVIPSKDAATVAKAIYDRWICRFGCPLQVVTDQGKEFCAQLTDELFSLLNIQHTTTTAYHPQCNSQAEVANKTIAKYLSRVVGEDTLDWEDYIGPLMFSYNTSFHRSIKNTPFFLTHGMEARQPGFNAADVRNKFEGPGSPEEMLERLQKARRIAQEENEQVTLQAQMHHDKKAEPHGYVRDQLVLLEDNYFASRNAKLAPKFTGPHRILELKGESNVVLKMAQSGRKVTVHVDRLKPYHAQRSVTVKKISRYLHHSLLHQCYQNNQVQCQQCLPDKL
jgi:transposase InsO family protein